MAEIGKQAELTVLRQVEFGSYLDGGGLGEILLPRKYEPDTLREGDRLSVFLYHDSEGRPIATTETALAEVGEFATLTVNAVTDQGAFLEWGLTRALFVPFREQRQRLQPGQQVVVYLYIDQQTGRVVGSTRLNRWIDTDTADLAEGDSVELLLYQQTPLGFKAVVDGRYTGVLYKSELLQPLQEGDAIAGYISHIREDGKIDLTLARPGMEKVEDFAEQLLVEIKMANGLLPFGDNSPPEEIRARFGVSKKTFKRAAGQLFKQRLIVIYPNQLLLQ